MKKALRSLFLAMATVLSGSAVSASADSDAARMAKAEAIYALTKQSGFSGVVEISMAGYGFYQPHGGAEKGRNHLWRWASVTKQVVAVLVMQEVAKGTIALDTPVSTYLPRFKSPNANKITVRQLLRHQSGLPNPDDVVSSSSISEFYLSRYEGSRDPLTGFCAGMPKGDAGGQWQYNNCDYMVAGALLEAVTGQSWQKLVASRIAEPLGLETLKAYPAEVATNRGYIDGVAEPEIDLAAFGAAGSLYGSTGDLARFDLALMNGELLPKDQLDQLWDGRPELGYIALGQWVFSVPLKGCAEPVKIVERRGAIGGVQLRNFILPDKRAVVVAVTDEARFEFGEIWQGSGFSHDLLAATACS